MQFTYLYFRTLSNSAKRAELLRQTWVTKFAITLASAKAAAQQLACVLYNKGLNLLALTRIFSSYQAWWLKKLGGSSPIIC